MNISLNVVYEYDDDTGGWGAYLPDLPGCVAVGRSRDDVMQLIREAIPMHLEAMIADDDPMPEPGRYSEQLRVEIDDGRVRVVEPVQA